MPGVSNVRRPKSRLSIAKRDTRIALITLEQELGRLLVAYNRTVDRTDPDEADTVLVMRRLRALQSECANVFHILRTGDR